MQVLLLWFGNGTAKLLGTESPYRKGEANWLLLFAALVAGQSAPVSVLFGM